MVPVPPALDALLRHAPPLNELGPGQPVVSWREELQAFDLAAAFAPRKIVNSTMIKACLAGLWLRFDFLEQSHTLSQSIDNSTGSFWHGIMHRREPDYENAKYWFRRVGEHPVFVPLCAAVRSAVAGKLADPKLADARFLETQMQWNPFRFVDLAANVSRNSPAAEFCRKVQLLEWQLLFEYCCEHAFSEGR